LTEARVWNFLRQLPHGLTWTQVLLPCQAAGWLRARHPAVSSPCQAWSPYIAFPRPLAFECLTGSKCSKCIKRCTFFKNISWSPPADQSWSETVFKNFEHFGSYLLEVAPGLWSYSSLTRPHTHSLFGEQTSRSFWCHRWISSNRLHVTPPNV